ncbi:ImmA/IrrE family metallo-endopeptidase [Actinocatenispora sera]|nr:ImmA/IrrE family metallo-endopeptidase [Actinocatenispora sera]
MRQLEEYARATHAPLGFFFLSEPPTEELPVHDFRTFDSQAVHTPTPDLLDTIYLSEQRQEWYRHFAIRNGEPRVAIVGSLSVRNRITEAAAYLRDALHFDLSSRTGYSNWNKALSGLVANAEDVGILVMISGIVGSNTHRKLDPREFRGFSLVDRVAPVIFINGVDTKAAQIFTLAHEIAHVSLGESALSKPDLSQTNVTDRTERWCNSVAAELLVPLESIRDEYEPRNRLTEELNRLARYYKVSTLVILRRIFDADLISHDNFETSFSAELRRVMALLAKKKSTDGGDYYNTQPVRLSKRFARALISDTLEGGTLYGEAFRLLGSKKLSVFEELGQRLGVA